METPDKIPLNQALANRRRAEDDVLEVRIAKVREKIRKNFPNPRAPLMWRKASASMIVSTCGRFWIEASGEGDTRRYKAMMKPHTVIGFALLTPDAAKEVCNRHASPLIPAEPKEDPRAQREAERYPDP